MNGLQRFLDVSGAPGVIGGQAAELLLREGSSLDELKNVFAGKTGALFVASIMIPADLAGIAPDSPQGKSLLTFAQELGLGFQVADDLEDPESAWEPDHILYYLSRVEAAQLSSRGLRSSTESLQRTWGENASALVRISNEVQAKLAAGSGA
jgi:hypothetical protein